MLGEVRWRRLRRREVRGSGRVVQPCLQPEAVTLVESHEPCELTLVHAAGPISLPCCGLTPRIVLVELLKDFIVLAVEPVHGFRFPVALPHILTSHAVVDQVLLVELAATLE